MKQERRNEPPSDRPIIVIWAIFAETLEPNYQYLEASLDYHAHSYTQHKTHIIHPSHTNIRAATGHFLGLLSRGRLSSSIGWIVCPLHLWRGRHTKQCRKKVAWIPDNALSLDSKNRGALRRHERIPGLDKCPENGGNVFAIGWRQELTMKSI